MDLQNTIILPDNQQEAIEKLKQILAEDVLLITVFGNDSSAQNAVQSADISADNATHGVGRKVVWMKNENLKPEFNDLIKDGSFQKSQINSQTVAVSLSLVHTLEDVLSKNDDIDGERMDNAFLRGARASR